MTCGFPEYNSYSAKKKREKTAMWDVGIEVKHGDPPVRRVDLRKFRRTPQSLETYALGLVLVLIFLCHPLNNCIRAALTALQSRNDFRIFALKD